MILSWRSQAETLILALLLLSDDKSFHGHQLRGGRACTMEPKPWLQHVGQPRSKKHQSSRNIPSDDPCHRCKGTVGSQSAIATS